jgi:hypothetical protein
MEVKRQISIVAQAGSAPYQHWHTIFLWSYRTCRFDYYALLETDLRVQVNNLLNRVHPEIFGLIPD